MSGARMRAPRGWALATLLALVLGGASALAWLTGGPSSGSASAASSGSEALVVSAQSLLPGCFELTVRNDGSERVRVAQVTVNSGFVDFRGQRRALAPGESGKLTVPYPLIHGETYQVSLLTGEGATIPYELEG